jgi:hypothetical protein
MWKIRIENMKNVENVKEIVASRWRLNVVNALELQPMA